MVNMAYPLPSLKENEELETHEVHVLALVDGRTEGFGLCPDL